MPYPKVPAEEIKLRRENLNLTVEKISALLRIETPTWKRWERIDSAPAFVHFLLIAVENGFTDRQKTDSAKRIVTENIAERFFEKTETLPNGCRLWKAGIKFKIGDKSYTPRKTAWFLRFGEFPENDVLPDCQTENCIEHLRLGKETGSREMIPAAKKSAIILELRQGKLGAEIADKYKVSEGTISALRKLIKNTK